MSIKSNNMHPSNTGLSTLEMGAIMLLSMLILIPQFQLTIFILDAFYLAYAFTTSAHDTIYRKTMVKMLLVIVYIAILYVLLNDASSISRNASNYMLKRFVSKASQYMSMFFPLCILYRVKNFATNKQQNILLIVVFASLLFSCYSTLTGIQTDFMAARHSSFDADKDFSMVGYYEVYAYSFLTLMFFVLFFIQRKQRLVNIFFFLFFFYFLYRVQFALSMVIVAISMVFAVWKYAKNSFTKIAFLIGIVFAFTVLPALLDVITPLLDTELAQTKASELSGFLRFEYDEDSDLWGRLRLYWLSIKAFLYSPIWGNRTLPFDGHATLLMCFADLGILGGIPVWYLFIKANKIVKWQMEDKALYFSPFFFMIIVDGLTNPIHSQTPLYILLWCFIPIVLTKYLPEPSKKNHNG